MKVILVGVALMLLALSTFANEVPQDVRRVKGIVSSIELRRETGEDMREFDTDVSDILKSTKARYINKIKLALLQMKLHGLGAVSVEELESLALATDELVQVLMDYSLAEVNIRNAQKHYKLTQEVTFKLPDSYGVSNLHDSLLQSRSFLKLFVIH
jgi:hypothetical protein